MLTVIVRTIIIYFAAVFAFRFMGKRQVGEMQLSELTVAILMSELLAGPATDSDTPLLYGIIPMAVLVCSEVLISFAVMKIKFLSDIFETRPSIVIEHGCVIQKELLRLRFSANELASALRQKDIDDISEVDYAVLEPNGKLSVFPKDCEKAVTKADLKLPDASDGISFSVICDGKISKNSLSSSGKTEKDVNDFLKNKKLKLSDVFLLSVNSDGNFSLIKKEATK